MENADPLAIMYFVQTKDRKAHLQVPACNELEGKIDLPGEWMTINETGENCWSKIFPLVSPPIWYPLNNVIYFFIIKIFLKSSRTIQYNKEKSKHRKILFKSKQKYPKVHLNNQRYSKVLKISKNYLKRPKVSQKVSQQYPKSI